MSLSFCKTHSIDSKIINKWFTEMHFISCERSKAEREFSITHTYNHYNANKTKISSLFLEIM